tara:strand:+ start:1544 stop:1753 length:210 start_codon:yes stop_codon:yes gene_type:complete
MSGVSAMFVGAVLLGINIDTLYDIKEERLLIMNNLCLKFDSTPYSYDATEVTCSNGTTLTYRSLYKEGE